MTETPEEKFERVVERRHDNATKALELMQNLTDKRGYRATPERRKNLITELETMVTDLADAWGVGDTPVYVNTLPGAQPTAPVTNVSPVHSNGSFIDSLQNDPAKLMDLIYTATTRLDAELTRRGVT
jgi:hypothetical protein